MSHLREVIVPPGADKLDYWDIVIVALTYLPDDHPWREIGLRAAEHLRELVTAPTMEKK